MNHGGKCLSATLSTNFKLKIVTKLGIWNIHCVGIQIYLELKNQGMFECWSWTFIYALTVANINTQIW